MTIEDAIVYGKKYVHSIDAKMLISNVTGIDTLDLINHLHNTLTSEEESKYKELIEKKINDRPIQYITNSVNFYGLPLYVDENVLIPRFETEELVDNTIKYLNSKFQNPKVLDLCCGSGAIGLAIKSRINDADVYMSDISKEALVVAEKNKQDLFLDGTIIESDLFTNINDKYDCIICNPPYIKDNEEIEDIVRNNEPHLALFAGPDGLDYYKRILKEIKKYLKDEFLIAFEIGATQKDDVINLANEYLENIDIICKKDLSNRDRMIFITNK
jgi:release factor glutamine methyltransferase